MESKHIEVPKIPNYERAQELAYKLLIEKLAAIDIEQQCRNSGSQCQTTDSGKLITIQYLSRRCLLALPDIRITWADDGSEVPLRERVLILHYVTTAKGTPPANKLITFRELPEGAVYYPTFDKRTIKPILQYFSQEPDLLLEASKELGGRKVDYGDIAVAIDVFNRVPITFVMYRGDEEFSPQGNVLFDANVTDYLPTEGITIACEITTWKLVGYFRKVHGST